MGSRPVLEHAATPRTKPRGFRGTLSLDKLPAPVHRATLAQARLAWRKRAARFLDKDPAERSERKGPPLKRHRVKTLEWLLALDNALRVTTSGCLESYCVPENAEGRDCRVARPTKARTVSAP